MKIHIEVDEQTLKRLVLLHVKDTLGNVPVELSDIIIEVKSKQNYKAEWETAAFRARVGKVT